MISPSNYGQRRKPWENCEGRGSGSLNVTVLYREPKISDIGAKKIECIPEKVFENKHPGLLWRISRYPLALWSSALESMQHRSIQEQ